MRQPAMAHLLLIIFTAYFFPHYMMMNFKQQGLEKLTRADKFINVVGSIGLIINAGGRFCGGLLFRKFGIKIVAGLIVFTMTTSAVLFLPMSATKLTFTMQLWYFDFGYGLLNCTSPLINHEVFGSDGPITYSLLMTAFALSSYVVAFSQSYLTSVIGQGTLLLMLAMFSVVPVPFWYKIFAFIESKNSPQNNGKKERLIEMQDNQQ